MDGKIISRTEGLRRKRRKEKATRQYGQSFFAVAVSPRVCRTFERSAIMLPHASGRLAGADRSIAAARRTASSPELQGRACYRVEEPLSTRTRPISSGLVINYGIL